MLARSISSTFYGQRSQKRNKYSQTVSLFGAFGICTSKSWRKILVKLTPGVNFINILHVHFSYKSAWGSFSLVIFWQQKALSYKKCAQKMLMKLTPDEEKKYLSSLLHQLNKMRTFLNCHTTLAFIVGGNLISVTCDEKCHNKENMEKHFLSFLSLLPPIVTVPREALKRLSR
jgi:hypothetical protein